MARPDGPSDFRTTRQATLALVEDVSQATADARPGDGWSVGEVLDHLLRFDELFGREIERLIAQRLAGQSAFLARTFGDLGFSVPFVPKALQPLIEPPLVVANLLLPERLRLAFIQSRLVPAKAPKTAIPTQGKSIDDLRASLAAFPASLGAQLAASPDIDPSALRYYQPLVGFKNLPGMLAFLAGHERRHQGQIRDLLRTRRGAGE